MGINLEYSCFSQVKFMLVIKFEKKMALSKYIHARK